MTVSRLFAALILTCLGFTTQGCLVLLPLVTEPTTYAPPPATEAHAEVRLQRSFGSVTRERLRQQTKVGTSVLPDADGIVRVKPGQTRWTFETGVTDSDSRYADVTVTCNASAAFTFEKGRRYHLVYTFEGHNQCRITCTDTTDGLNCQS